MLVTRFVAPSIAKKYDFDVPEYEGIDQIVEAESRPARPYDDSPLTYTTSPIYDDVSTYFTRGSRLPTLQTNLPPHISQINTAISTILSPVQETYGNLSESNHVTPIGDATTVARDQDLPAPPSNKQDETETFLTMDEVRRRR